MEKNVTLDDLIRYGYFIYDENGVLHINEDLVLDSWDTAEERPKIGEEVVPNSNTHSAFSYYSLSLPGMTDVSDLTEYSHAPEYYNHSVGVAHFCLSGCNGTSVIFTVTDGNGSPISWSGTVLLAHNESKINLTTIPSHTPYRIYAIGSGGHNIHVCMKSSSLLVCSPCNTTCAVHK